MNRGAFVTGTDTGVGKTLVASALIRALRRRGLVVAGYKPVAAGAECRDGKLRNDDALTLADASGLDGPYCRVNPYCFAPAIAPHIAAADRSVVIELDIIKREFNELQRISDAVVAEGAGGWLVPLGRDLTMADVARTLDLPVLMVVGLRLGCLNHALLTAQAIQASGVRLAGWIGSQVDPAMPRPVENLATLDAQLDVPCLGVMGNPQHPACADVSRPLFADGF